MIASSLLQRWPTLALLLLCAVLYWPGQTQLPPMDRDEARFAQASKQMLASGDYIDIRFQDEPRHKKPVGIYWLQTLSAGALNMPDSIAAYRLPSWLGAMVAVLCCAALIRRATGNSLLALGGGMMLASTLLVVVEAHLAKTDAALLGVVTAMQYCLYQIVGTRREARGTEQARGARHEARGISFLHMPYRLLLLFLSRLVPRASCLIFWLLLGLGLLLKGPIAPLIALMTLLVLRYGFGECGVFARVWSLAGFLLMLAVVAPWAVLIHLHTGGAFWYESVVVDLLSKAAAGQESHGAAPGYYAALSPVLLWPWWFVIILALPFWRRLKHLAAVRFATAWAVPTWLLFELMPTKLPHYILPALPALVLFTAVAWQECAAYFFAARWRRILCGGYAALSAALLLAPVAALPIALKIPVLWWSIVPAVFGISLVWFAWKTRRALPLLGAAVSLYLALFFLHVPHAQPLWVSQRLAALIPPETPIALAGFSEPSAVFLIDTDISLGGAEGAAAFLLAHPGGIAVVEQRQMAAFRAAAADAPMESIGTVRGLNYSNGKWVELTLWRNAR